jgi:LPXTG-motif cell wall-anchored protein
VTVQMRRLITLAAGVLALTLLFIAPSGAQQSPGTVPSTTPPSVSPSSVVPPGNPPTSSTRPTPTSRPTQVGGDVVENPPAQQPKPQVQGDVVTRPLPRTGSELNGTAIAGAALTVAGVGIALAARRRRNAYEGS